MCGRLVRDDDTTGELARERFTTDEIADRIESGFNFAPGRLLTVVVENREGQRELRKMQWGLKRSFAGPGAPAPSNARAETILQKSLFRDLLGTRRCLVPMSGYYEWQQIDGRKIPHFIRPTDRNICAFAGLYDAWRGEDGAINASFCLITTTPAESIAAIHDRMPVVLRQEDEALWLDRSMNDESRILPLLRAYPSDRLTAYPVGDSVNDARKDGQDLIAPRKERIAPQLALPLAGL